MSSSNEPKWPNLRNLGVQEHLTQCVYASGGTQIMGNCGSLCMLRTGNKFSVTLLKLIYYKTFLCYPLHSGYGIYPSTEPARAHQGGPVNSRKGPWWTNILHNSAKFISLTFYLLWVPWSFATKNVQTACVYGEGWMWLNSFSFCRRKPSHTTSQLNSCP